MKKLRLALDELEVETFHVAAAEEERKGTVFGNSENPNCGYTAVGGPCLITSDCTDSPCTAPYYCAGTYECNTFTECTFAA
jgi:hypothetical protein